MQVIGRQGVGVILPVVRQVGRAGGLVGKQNRHVARPHITQRLIGARIRIRRPGQRQLHQEVLIKLNQRSLVNDGDLYELNRRIESPPV